LRFIISFMTFNPNQIGIPNGNYFALPFTAQEAALVLLSAPWDVTTSYRAGTAQAPQAIIDASAQVDLFDLTYGDIWQCGIGTLPIDKQICKCNARMRTKAARAIALLEKGIDETHSSVAKLTTEVNLASQWFNDKIYTATAALLQQGKRVGLVGGDHSVPYGYLRALAEQHSGFGILHIDAHCDLREKYEGFEFSHASIMYNVLTNIPQVQKIVQVGIRDLCADEHTLARSDSRICLFDNYAMAKELFEGSTWAHICEKIIVALPPKVYISFDIDGLMPDNCPNTGTPVPGGLSFLQTCYLLQQLNKAGKQIIGFDLCEVNPDAQGEWDAIVGARILYKLCGCALYGCTD
jgi:agmatinase